MSEELIRDAFATKLQPLHGERFEAFACQDLKWHDGKARPLPIDTATTLDDAVTMAQAHCPHKTTFFVKRTDTFTGAVTLHFYAVRQQSKARFVRRPGMAHAVQERPHYAEHLFDLALTADVVAACRGRELEVRHG